MEMQVNENAASTCGSGCGCSPVAANEAVLGRRDFLRVAGSGALVLSGSLALAGTQRPATAAVAGPFATEDFETLVPRDKKLDPAWVRSLSERGEPDVLRGDNLRWVGMPIGGIGAGQLYLGGDGRLWHWDIWNQNITTTHRGDHYAHPMTSDSPIQQGFTLEISAGGQTQKRTLDNVGFSDVSFLGQYPIGTVEYRDPAAPVQVTLEAFSPFIPLATDDSSLPATIFSFAIRNHSGAPVEVLFEGHLQNAVSQFNSWAIGARRNRIVRGDGLNLLECSAQPIETDAQQLRDDIVFENWSRGSYEGWEVEGTAFGARPVRQTEIIDYQGPVGGEEKDEYVVNSHAAAPGTNAAERDNNVGRLLSRTFTIERPFVHFWIGGGSHPGRTAFNLLVDGKVVASETGRNDNRMVRRAFDAREYVGKTARLEIVDNERGPWGQIGIGRITFSDRAVSGAGLEEMADYGTMALALLGAPAEAFRADRTALQNLSEATAAPAQVLAGALGRRVKLNAGQTARVEFVLAWHFPNLEIGGLGRVGRHYATRFASASEVARHLSDNFARLSSQTRLWRDTWYDSTLPHWLLDRTLMNASILATSTCFRFESGRFWAWEGVGCCAGTCAHVWHYAHSVARLFPDLERSVRERADYGVGFDEGDGHIGFRAEFDRNWAADAQAGTILRVLREHQMSADSEFLQRLWERVRLSLQFLMTQDTRADIENPKLANGILEGRQHNTLDADWFGPVAWLSGLYVAALRAGEEMAREMGDETFARQCREVFERGRRALVQQLFEGEYFINRPDPNHPKSINSGTGCLADQVFGQSWALQVGLGRDERIFPQRETMSALRALWNYNYTPDVKAFRVAYPSGRWYAMAGEGGLLMCTFPRDDWDYLKASGNNDNFLAAYFNESWTGFEYQVAGHMIGEGMVEEGLVITRTVHDRYDASKRNPWNEIECGDHYARAMASYGVFIAACGFNCHGPRGHLGFAPKLHATNFKAAFTAAQGWGSFTQRVEDSRLQAEIDLRWGELALSTLELQLPEGVAAKRVKVEWDGRGIKASSKVENGRFRLQLAEPIMMKAGQKLRVRMG